MKPDVETVAHELCAHIRRHLLAPEVADQFDATSSFRDCGLDSFALVELILFAEQRFGLRLSERAMTPENLASAEALARALMRNAH